VRGARYLHVLVPCPLGWGTPTDETIELARHAVRTGLFPLFEAEDGDVVATTPIRRREPVTSYLERQSRFAHLFHPVRQDEVLDRIQREADRTVARYRLDRQEEGAS
jgi:pyruvate ferredoxin oxidoreductase beta subunit